MPQRHPNEENCEKGPFLSWKIQLCSPPTNSHTGPDQSCRRSRLRFNCLQPSGGREKRASRFLRKVNLLVFLSSGPLFGKKRDLAAKKDLSISAILLPLPPSQATHTIQPRKNGGGVASPFIFGKPEWRREEEEAILFPQIFLFLLRLCPAKQGMRRSVKKEPFVVSIGADARH